MERDTVAFQDTTNRRPDTTNVGLVRTDTLSRASIDTISARKDTTARELRSPQDTAGVRRDTTAIELVPRKSPTAADTKTLPLRSTSLDPNGYKNVHWGMTFKDVRDYLVDQENVNEYDMQPITNGFEYPGTIAGVKATLSYQFDNDRLYIVRLSPEVQAATRFDFLDSFDEYQTALGAKYGKPARTGFRKVDEQYLNTIESIQLGFAKKYALWEFERSYIVLVLAGRNRKLEIHITYVSRAIFDEMKDRIETLKVEDF